MITTVGMQKDFLSALEQLVRLDYDAIDAYEAAINRLENEYYQDKLEEFKVDHQRHIDEVSEFLRKNNKTPPVGSDIKSLLTQGKVVLAKLLGDETILRAMKSNEIDTNTAYERINSYKAIPQDIKEVLEKGLQDEKKHLAWLEEQLT